MRELSLFSGVGGGLLGTKLLGWKHCGYVEINDYCQRIIRQRIDDGILDEAPIFGDIRAFLDQGYAESYQGMVDVVTAGFPCQPFSVAGKQRGADDERNMWPQTLAVIRAIRPRFAFLENVPGLLAHEYIRRIFGDLAESGFDARWRSLSAAELGATHLRDREWIIASNTSGERLEKRGNISTSYPRQMGKRNKTRANIPRISSGEIRSSRNWPSESRILRKCDVVANRVDRIAALGNGQVPAVVRAAWRILSGE